MLKMKNAECKMQTGDLSFCILIYFDCWLFCRFIRKRRNLWVMDNESSTVPP